MATGQFSVVMNSRDIALNGSVQLPGSKSLTNSALLLAALVRCARHKVLLQKIRRDVEGVVTVGGAPELAAAQNPDVVLAHQTSDATLADTQAQLVQLLGHAPSVIASQAQPVLLTEMGKDNHVKPLADCRWPVPLGPKPAIRHAHQLA